MSKPVVTENIKTYPGINQNYVLPNGQKIKVIRVSELSQKMQSQVSKVLTKPNILSKPVVNPVKSSLLKPVILNTTQKPKELSNEVVTKSVQESSNNSVKEIGAQTSIDLPEPIDLDDVDDIDEPTESFLKIDPDLSAGKVVQLSPKADSKFVKLLLNGNNNLGTVKLVQSNGQSQAGGKVMVLNGNNLNNIRFISADNNKQVGGKNKIMLVNQQSMVQPPKPTITVKTDLCKPSTSLTSDSKPKKIMLIKPRFVSVAPPTASTNTVTTISRASKSLTPQISPTSPVTPNRQTIAVKPLGNDLKEPPKFSIQSTNVIGKPIIVPNKQAVLKSTTSLFQALKDKFVPLVGHACTIAIVDHLKMAYTRCHTSKIRAIRDLIQYVDNFKKYQNHKENNASSTPPDKHCFSKDVAIQTDEFGDLDLNQMKKLTEGLDGRDLIEAPDDLNTLKCKLFMDWNTALKPDNMGNMPVHVAVLNKDINVLKRLTMVLETLKELDVQNEQDQTALHLAITINAGRNIIQFLLEKGLNPELVDINGDNCIHLAVKHSNYILLELVIRKLQNVHELNAHNLDGMTPLMLCAKHNKVPEARILLDYFADPNIQDPKSGRSVLFFAIEYNNLELTQLLVNCGADRKLKNFSGVSPQDAACELNLNIELRALVVRGPSQSSSKRPPSQSYHLYNNKKRLISKTY